MKFTVTSERPGSVKAGCIILGVHEQRTLSSAAAEFDKTTGGLLKKVLKDGDMDGSSGQTVTVHYPFHPLHNHCLDIVAWPRQATQAVTVRHPDGRSIKIPHWMLQPEAADFHLSNHVHLSANTLLAVVDMWQACSRVVTANPLEAQSHATNHPGTRQRHGRASVPDAGTRTRTTAHRTDGAAHHRRRAQPRGRRS